jgi:predicted dehydrogenase
MADRIIEENQTEAPELPELLERVLLYALDEGRQKMESGEDVVPFTTLVVKENVFIESHPGDSADECFEAAKKTVGGARGADAYAFCYDGYIEGDEGTIDALIAEGGLPGEDDGHAIGLLYKIGDDEAVVFEEAPAYIGEAPNFMSALKEAAEYSDDEIEDKYIDPEVIGEEFEVEEENLEEE